MSRSSVLASVLCLASFGCTAEDDPQPMLDSSGSSGESMAEEGSSTGEPAGESSTGDDVEPSMCAGLSVTEVSLFQVLETKLWDDGAPVSAQSRAVPVVAGREALVRARFETASGWTSQNLDVRIEVQTGGETLEFETTATVNGSSDPDDPNSGVQLSLPPSAIAPDAALSVHLDACETATDPVAVEAVDTGPIEVHLVPFEVGGFVPDTSPAVIDGFRDAVLAVYPATEVHITVGDVVPDAYAGQLDMGALLVDLGVIQEQVDQADPDVYYYGLVTGAASREEFCDDCPTGTSESGSGNRAAFALGAAFADQRSEDTLIHELGHMHGLLHAPCGDPDLLDEDFPYDEAATGVEGYDFRTQTFVAPDAKDMMAYCYPRWISDHNYRKLVDWVQRAQSWD